jgi:hypothetical protein
MNLRDPTNRSLSLPRIDPYVSSDSTLSVNLDSDDSIQLVMALKVEILRLQSLVCDLLHENEQLRHPTLDGNAQVGEGTVSDRSAQNPFPSKVRP